MTPLFKDLLLIALGKKKKLSRIYSTEEWQKAYKLAERQGVLAICFGGIEALFKKDSSINPPKDQSEISNLGIPLKMQWIGTTISYQQLYNKHKQAIENLAKFYEKQKVKMLLIKGYGLSLDYPKPMYRPVGDVDIYLFGYKEIADQVVEQKLGIKVEREYRKHSHFIFQNVTVENHETFLDDNKHKSNVQYERTLENELYIKPLITTSIPNCYFPSATWNALFLVRHAGEHFAANEILMRHVLDLGTFFKAHHREIDWDFVLKVYKEEKIKLFYDAIATICVRDLDMQAKWFQGFSHNNKLADKTLVDIFSCKEQPPMSSNAPKNMGIIKYGFVKTLFWWHNRWKYKIVYNESLWNSFCSLALNRIKYR